LNDEEIQYVITGLNHLVKSEIENFAKKQGNNEDALTTMLILKRKFSDKYNEPIEAPATHAQMISTLPHNRITGKVFDDSELKGMIHHYLQVAQRPLTICELANSINIQNRAKIQEQAELLEKDGVVTIHPRNGKMSNLVELVESCDYQTKPKFTDIKSKIHDKYSTENGNYRNQKLRKARFDKILSALNDSASPLTIAEISQKTGISYQALLKYTLELEKSRLIITKGRRPIRVEANRNISK
jgi:predicted Rossmann fold nucleotide-binding protein DprA/Smf involved in DNA uptake